MIGHFDQLHEARRANVNATELAAKPIAYQPDRLPERAIIELKTDGIGLIDVNGHVQSLNGVAFDCAKHLVHELSAIRAAFGQPMMLHGEFFEPGGFNATLSAFNSGESKGGCVVLWDAVPLKVWLGHELSSTLLDRRSLLQAAFDAVRPGMVSLAAWTPVPNATVNGDARESYVRGALEAAVRQGQEGLVIKDTDSPYQRGRSPFWLKLKPMETLDVPVQAVRLDEHDRVQSIVVTVNGRPAVVGSGISEELRNRPEEFAVGRLVEISHVGQKTPVIRGASFVRFRDDKAVRP